MKNKSSIAALFGAITLSSVGLAPAMTVLFSDDFEDGDVSDWGGGAYSNGALNADTPTQTLSPGGAFNGTSGSFTMDTVMFDLDSNPSWAGTQVASPAISGSVFTGYAPADITMGFTYAVTADPGVTSYVRFELREVGVSTTHQTNSSVADISGGINTESFTLDTNQSTFTAFNPASNYQIYAQIHQSWAVSGSTRNIGLTMDDFFITAIPETSSSLLALFGAALLFGRRRR